jgi:hypothetical protein
LYELPFVSVSSIRRVLMPYVIVEQRWFFFTSPRKSLFPSVPPQDPVGGTEGSFLQRQKSVPPQDPVGGTEGSF